MHLKRFSKINILNFNNLIKRYIFVAKNMACSRFEYVKTYEQPDPIVPNVWIVIRLDGKGFHKFSKTHNFEKPNDINALNLMTTAAMTVMEDFNDIILAYGQSDEYSFVFRKETNLYKRRSSKLLSYVTSLFTSAYVLHWSDMMQQPLHYPPCFDGRVVIYPSDQNLKDYLSWRQADVHVNNLYNTAFWSLVLKERLTNQQAEAELRGTYSADKNELMFSRFGINYNSLPAMFRKGTTLLRKRVNTPQGANRQLIVPISEDMIKEKFWKTHTELLGKYVPGDFNISDSTNSENCQLLLKKQFDKILVCNKTFVKDVTPEAGNIIL